MLQTEEVVKKHETHTLRLHIHLAVLTAFNITKQK